MLRGLLHWLLAKGRGISRGSLRRVLGGGLLCERKRLMGRLCRGGLREEGRAE